MSDCTPYLDAQGIRRQAPVLPKRHDLPSDGLAFLGLIAEPVVITIAVAALGGVRFPRWFMNAAQVVYFIGFAFAYWLFYEAYFNIGALCPWCLLVTVTTTMVFASMTRVNIYRNTFGLSEGMHTRLTKWLDAWVIITSLSSFLSSSEP